MKKITIGIGMALAAGAVVLALVFWLWGADERMFSALEAGRRPADAHRRLARIVERRPDDLNAQQWLIRLDLEAGNLSAARNRLTLLQVKAPDYYGTVSNACMFHLMQRTAAKAVRDCARAAELSGRSVEDLNRLASAYLLKKDFSKSLPVLQEALRKAPNNVKVLNNYGYYFLLVGVQGEAIKYFKQALEVDPGFLEARKNLAHSYYENKQYPEAVAEIKTVLAKDPYNKDLLMIMAIIQYKFLNDRTKAREYAKRAIDAGMDDDRAAGLMKMLAVGHEMPGPPPSPPFNPPPPNSPMTPTPNPVGPDEARRIMQQRAQNQAGNTAANPPKPPSTSPPTPPSGTSPVAPPAAPAPGTAKP